MEKFFRITYLALFAILISAGCAYAGTVMISTETDATLWGTDIDWGDVVEANISTHAVNVILDEHSFVQIMPQVDAFHILPNGNYIVSSVWSQTLGGLTFDSADLAEYNPLTNTATLFFSQSLFVDEPGLNIDAVYVRPSGNIVMSVSNHAVLGGVSFDQDDIVEYNPSTNTSTLLFDFTPYFTPFPNPTDLANIDGLHILNNSDFIISTSYNSILGGQAFLDGDLIEYNPVTNIPTLYFSENNFSSFCENIDAVYIPETTIPEPATIALFGLGFTGLLGLKRKRSVKA